MIRIERLSFSTFRSLRHVDFSPTPLAVIVGPNGAGKTNLSDAVNFLSDVYTSGLSHAVAQRGGYENIAHRKQRRSKSPIEAEVIVRISADEWRMQLRRSARRDTSAPDLLCRHKFAFQVTGSAIRATYRVISEELDLSLVQSNGQLNPLLSLRRSADGTVDVTENHLSDFAKLDEMIQYSDYDFRDRIPQQRAVPDSELYITGRYIGIISVFSRLMSRIRVFRLNARDTREDAAPSPQARMTTFGDNLPAVVDDLRESENPIWSRIITLMQRVMPGLTDIRTSYTSRRTLGLEFYEEGVGRPWSVDEVSDGTLQTLAILVAIADPNLAGIFIEEPENSVHPWIIRELMDLFRELSKEKTVLITSHSPVVMDQVSPDEIFVLYRRSGETRIVAMNDVSPQARRLWESGRVTTFEYIDTGSIEEALPPVISGAEA